MASDSQQSQISLRPLERDGFATRILKSLTAYIQAAELKAGDRLPTERALAAQLGVGRSTVREALQTWQAMGLVQIRKGSGTYLAQDIRATSLHVPVTINLEREAVLNSLELRRAIETDAARLAARRGRAEDVERIRAALEEMEAAYAAHGFAIRQDRTFHEAMFTASGNPLYLQIFQQIITRISDAFNGSRENPFVTEPYADESQPDHRRLYEAVAEGDEAGAVAAVMRIIDFVEAALRHDQ
ncbi:L-lactate utilization operon repressor [Jannaschia seosinensis]|uniref:L-lactate utilization operon repressor n=1 Tax=Jannaschia seosinensis TaxID=313367 RepID=A0A0M7BBW7_9RHOB|nr:FadR/GntR family transcriptional regulator [Jannaschia seosinensis]CUH40230.1 L-lactate utilization operon repressor [Jannaschia seosinensis]